MEITCGKCGSPHLIKRGTVTKSSGTVAQRFVCSDCHRWMNVDISFNPPEQQTEFDYSEQIDDYEYESGNKTFVITCAVNDTPVHEGFLKSLENYCAVNSAELIIVPVKYHRGKMLEEPELVWPDSIQKYLFAENKKLMKGLKLFGGLHISPSIGNPLSGFDSFSKGDSIIIPHSQLQMRSIAVSHTDNAAIMTTTGAITLPIYTETKQGEKASFNHSFSAVMVESDDEHGCFHMRHLSASSDGSFYDLKHKYGPDYVEASESIPAIVLGDLHVEFIDPVVAAATFAKGGIIDYLKPKKIIAGDILDAYSISHHHEKNIFTKFAKYGSGRNKIDEELHRTVSFIVDNTPEGSEFIVNTSNHNSHLLKYLNECQIKNEPWNMLFYHEMMYLMLRETKMGKEGAVYPNPLALWAENNYNCENIKFLSGTDSYKVMGIECAYHGDRGLNGSRGSVEQYANLGFKSIIQHSHSPKIERGSYQVGHSCYSKLEYNIGSPSSWMHSHVVIQPNGKRQHIHIINGNWKRRR